MGAHETIEPTPFKLVRIEPETTNQVLLDELKQISWPSSRLVVKPSNASGSIGVRPVDLEHPNTALEVLRDFLNILRSMPVEPETTRCDISEIVAEQRHEGEEFSVESRRVRHSVDTVAIHWKIDIDRDNTRFFERLFVTLPKSDEVYRLLATANKDLLRAIGVGDGVFHAEYRVDLASGRVCPLEVGLRPGGGMVSSSVHEARGVDLFEAAIRCAIQTTENQPNKHNVVPPA